jgi:hypothetical protein
MPVFFWVSFKGLEVSTPSPVFKLSTISCGIFKYSTFRGKVFVESDYIAEIVNSVRTKTHHEILNISNFEMKS